jgi:hypothetical protein
VEREEAAHLLGVAVDAAPFEARAAYRRLIRTHHPDAAGAASTDLAARLIAAWEAMREPTGPAPAVIGPPPERPPRPHWAGAGLGDATPAGLVTVHGDTLHIGLTREEAFVLLLDCAHDLGEVTYVDPDVGLLETIVEFEDEPTCSLLVSLQGRAGHIDAFCTIEPLTAEPAPAIAAVAHLLARTAWQRLTRTTPS